MGSIDQDVAVTITMVSGPELTENSKARCDRDGRPIHTLAQHVIERSKEVNKITELLKAHKCRELRPKLDYLGDFECNGTDELAARYWMYDHSCEILDSDRNAKDRKATFCDKQAKIAREREANGEEELLDWDRPEIRELWGFKMEKFNQAHLATVLMVWDELFDQDIFSRLGSRDLASDSEHCGPYGEPLSSAALEAPPPVDCQTWADLRNDARVSPATSKPKKRQDSLIGRAYEAAVKRTKELVKRMSFTSRDEKSSRESSVAESNHSSLEGDESTPISSLASSQRAASDAREKVPNETV